MLRRRVGAGGKRVGHGALRGRRAPERALGGLACSGHRGGLFRSSPPARAAWCVNRRCNRIGIVDNFKIFDNPAPPTAGHGLRQHHGFYHARRGLGPLHAAAATTTTTSTTKCPSLFLALAYITPITGHWRKHTPTLGHVAREIASKLKNTEIPHPLFPQTWRRSSATSRTPVDSASPSALNQVFAQEDFPAPGGTAPGRGRFGQRRGGDQQPHDGRERRHGN